MNDLIYKWHALNKEYSAHYYDPEKLAPFSLEVIAVAEEAMALELLAVAMTLEPLNTIYYRSWSKDANIIVKVENIHLRSIDIVEKSLGCYHVAVATNLQNLTKFYQLNKRLEDQEKVLLKVLNNTNTHYSVRCDCLCNLAKVSLVLNKYEEATKFITQAVLYWRNQNGQRLRTISDELCHFSYKCEMKKQFQTAELCFFWAVKTLEKEFGVDSERTCRVLNLLAAFYCRQNLYDKAVPIFNRTNNQIELANVYTAQEKFALAEPIYKQELEKTKIMREEDVPFISREYFVAKRLNDLGLFYMAQNLFLLAESNFKEAIEVYRSNHHSILPFLENLEKIYRINGKVIEAEAIAKQKETVYYGDIKD